MSKYVLRVKGRHIWNPSNFGICVLLFLAPETVASLSIQWGNYLWPMLIIWTLGSIIIWRRKRFHICATYVVSFLVFAFLRSWITGHPWQAEVAPITGPMYQLFVFFMITDPKTTVHSKWAQCVVVFLVALAEMILRLAEVVYAPFYALFLVGPAANLIEIWWNSRKQSWVTRSSRLRRAGGPLRRAASKPTKQSLRVCPPCSSLLTTDRHRRGDVGRMRPRSHRQRWAERVSACVNVCDISISLETIFSYLLGWIMRPNAREALIHAML